MLISWNEIIKLCNITGIIHAGAHNGEEKIFYGNIPCIWIEPNLKLAKPLIKKGFYVICCAVSDKAGYEMFYENNNLATSSFLEPNLNMKRGIKTVHTYTVQCVTLDSIIPESGYNFLNMDIQGGELKALKGLKFQRSLIDYIYTEVHLVETYKNCPNIHQIDQELKGYKRVLTHMIDKYGWGDALYIKKELL